MGVGAYAYFDTLQVAKTAVELFERDTVIEAEAPPETTNAADPAVDGTERKAPKPPRNKRSTL